jgi:hypothetical protein
MIVFDWIFSQANVAINKSNREFNAKELAIMYNEWVAEVKENVPNEKLLVFAPQDGWKPLLCEFLSPLSDHVQSNCNDILESDEAYPHVNETEQVARIVRILDFISTAFEYGPAFACSCSNVCVVDHNENERE